MHVLVDTLNKQLPIANKTDSQMHSEMLATSVTYKMPLASV